MENLLKVKSEDCKVKQLGENQYPSPVKADHFVQDSKEEAVITELSLLNKLIQEKKELPGFQSAGPRKKLFFQPGVTKAGIVTCGGLSPGLNDVIRSMVMCLYYNYGIKEILGFRFGYQGITHDSKYPPMKLDPHTVLRIHNSGGTIIGSSRGNPGVEKIVDYLEDNNIEILFTIGGDGTLKGADAINEECQKRGLNFSIIGIPKTIDNDISFVAQTFGFSTAIEEARRSIETAQNEGRGAPNGIGLVKLMGRDSGFIAANAVLAENEANFCLIPEVDFDLEGRKGLLYQLEKRIIRKGNAVIVVAEGAGQHLFAKEKLKLDASGNVVYNDIGLYLKDKIKNYFKAKTIPVNIKYIDPSYTIRSLRANAEDSAFCLVLGQNAVHAAMAGKTGIVIGSWNNSLVHIPIPLATKERKKISPHGSLWQYVRFATGQPDLIN